MKKKTGKKFILHQELGKKKLGNKKKKSSNNSVDNNNAYNNLNNSNTRIFVKKKLGYLYTLKQEKSIIN